MKKRLNQSQKEIFLHSEGDAWYARNRNVIKVKNYLNDPIVKSIQKIVECESPSKMLSILEIGCGDGARLSFIKNSINCQCFGIDPSAQAVREANLKGVSASIGTAEKLPFEKQTFDIVIYGFCLYLCDREDLFEIASESNRVLKKESWLIIHDFFSPHFSHQKYKHVEGVHSYKMDYKSLFEWSPFYTCYFQSIDKHGSSFYTDQKNEWVQTAVWEKKLQPMASKLILGAAQFGLDYGITNKSGKIRLTDGFDILNFASKNGINFIDTAISYGDSEVQLGRMGVSKFEVYTKLPEVPQNITDIELWAIEKLHLSLKNLGIEKLAGVLLHRPDQLLQQEGSGIIRAMDAIKSLGIADKIGYSIYGPEESLRYERLYKPDFIQVPFSLMDRRILRNGWLEKQFNKNIKIHARSIFLQGLLLLPLKNIPSKFKYWNPQLVKLSEWLLDNSISPVSACLNYVSSNPLIDKVVFGVDNLAQLKEVIASYNPEIPLDFVDIAVEDERLLLPFNWDNL